MILEKNSIKKNLRKHFLELLDELLNRIWSEYWYCINTVYVQGKDSFSLLRLKWEDS